MKRYWLIEGYDSTTKIFDMKVPIGQLTDDQIKQTLKALAAKAGLEYEEIVGAYAKRRTRIANDLLEVHRDSPETTMFTCGTNPHFIASMVDENFKVIRRDLR